MLITPLANLMPSLTCAFLLCRTLVLITQTSWAVIKAVSRAPADTIIPYFSSRWEQPLLCLPQGDCKFGWSYARREGKSKGGKVCSLEDAGEELEVFVPCWGRALLWKVLTPFKMYAFCIYLYIIHTARLKKSGSDYPLCKPFLKNTICYVKSEKNRWQQLWNRICVAINYLD